MGNEKELTGGTEACGCGWKRPLIGITTLEGTLPPERVVPVYNCPCCGAFYVPVELSEEAAASVFANLMSTAQPIERRVTEEIVSGEHLNAPGSLKPAQAERFRPLEVERKALVDTLRQVTLALDLVLASPPRTEFQRKRALDVVAAATDLLRKAGSS